MTATRDFIQTDDESYGTRDGRSAYLVKAVMRFFSAIETTSSDSWALSTGTHDIPFRKTPFSWLSLIFISLFDGSMRS